MMQNKIHIDLIQIHNCNTSIKNFHFLHVCFITSNDSFNLFQLISNTLAISVVQPISTTCPPERDCLSRRATTQSVTTNRSHWKSRTSLPSGRKLCVCQPWVLHEFLLITTQQHKTFNFCTTRIHSVSYTIHLT